MERIDVAISWGDERVSGQAVDALAEGLLRRADAGLDAALSLAENLLSATAIADISQEQWRSRAQQLREQADELERRSGAA